MTDELEEREIPKEERDEADEGDFAGKNRSFPILKPEDVAAAAASLGRAGSDNYSTDQIKRNIIRIAKRKGAAFVARLPESWKESEGSEEFDGDVVDLTERALARDGSIELRLIKPGWGASGYYSKELLSSDGPKAWPAGTHMYLDHPTETESRERPERSVKDLAAVTISSPEYREKGRVGPGLYARASVLPQWKEAIEALAPYIGVSIRASGTFESGEAEGRQGKIIKSLIKGESVDFVTKPGAGGRVLAVMESLRRSDLPQNEDADVLSIQSETSDDTTSQEDQNMEELKEATERISSLETELEESKKATDEMKLRAERAEGALAILEAKAVIGEQLDNVELPSAAKARIVNKLAMDAPLTDGELDREKLSEAVEAEVKVEAEYIESITTAGKVTDQGTTDPDTDQTAVKERLGKGLGRFFGLSEDAAKRASEGR